MAYYRKLTSGLWQATVRTPDGRRRTRTDLLKSVVRVWAEDAEAAMRRGEWADPKDGRITLAEWWEQWSQARVIEYATTKRDESHWRVHVEPRWGHVKIGSITAWDVEGWVAKMKRDGVGGHALAQSVRLLRHMLSDAARHKMIPIDPTATVRIPAPARHVDRFLTQDEFWRLHEQMPTDRDKAVCVLMAYAGLRWAEAAGLEASAVDVERRQLLVATAIRRDGSVKRPKSDSGQRLVPTTAEVVEAVAPFLDGGQLFPGLDYSHWRARVFVPARDAACLHDPQPTPHDLRHSFGSWLAQNNVPAVDIQAFMGHASIRATERYLHAGDGRFARALVALHRPEQIESA
jgi:integrase